MIEIMFGAMCLIIFVTLVILVCKLVNWVMANFVVKNLLILLIPVAIVIAIIWFGITH